jgi:hypothetical protein
MAERFCEETRDHKCPITPQAPEPCAPGDCRLEGVNWCPGMPNRGRPPLGWAEPMAYREKAAREEAEREAAAGRDGS